MSIEYQLHQDNKTEKSSPMPDKHVAERRGNK